MISASIALGILQFVFAVLSSPQTYNMTPPQAISFAQSSVALVAQSLSTGTIDTATPTITLQTPSSMGSSTPIVVNVQPIQVINPSVPPIETPTLGAASQEVVYPVAPQLGNVVPGSSTIDIPWVRGNFDLLTLSLNGQTYSITGPNQTMHVTGLQPSMGYEVCETVSLNGVPLPTSSQRFLINNATFFTRDINGEEAVEHDASNTVHQDCPQ